MVQPPVLDPLDHILASVATGEPDFQLLEVAAVVDD